jgi:hypothetical protein
MNVLLAALGPSDTMRFLRQHKNGDGDYTEEQVQIFEGLSVEEICQNIRKLQMATSLVKPRTKRAEGLQERR